MGALQPACAAGKRCCPVDINFHHEFHAFPCAFMTAGAVVPDAFRDLFDGDA